MAVLNDALVRKLLPILKKYCPVDTGNLRDNGIQGVANIEPGLWLIQIGYPATPGYPATEDYALFTQIRNKTSKGWVTKALREWQQTYRNEINDYAERGLDDDNL